MILYNVTIKIDPEVADEWLVWMRRVHIPEVMKTGLFTDYRLCRVLVDESDGRTYSVQYSCPDLATLERYQKEHAAALQADHRQRYRDRYVAFRSLLEVL
ncbi:MAG: DUF4286 family protein [Bacteroidota bacterium]